MRWRVELTASAMRDISQALEWTRAKFGVKQHDRYRTMIRATIRRIANDPTNSQAKLHPDLKDNVRCMRIGPGKKARHLFFYRIQDDGLIVIGRLLHDAMDSSRHVPEGFADSD